MSAAAQSAVFARMLRPARAQPTAGLRGARAWSKALPRVSEQELGLVLSVEGHEAGVTDLESVLRDWDERSLSLSLAGPGAARGLAVLSPDLLAALIEVQTVGRVTTRPIQPRTPTAVDAALAGHVVDTWLRALAEVRNGPGAPAWAQTRRIADARAGKLALDDGVYEVETVHLDLGGGARSGQLVLIVPEGAEPGADPEDVPGPGGTVVLAIEAEVEAILTRVTVPLSWFQTAGPGTLIPIRVSDLGRMTLETSEGRVILRGRLGRVGARKAVRLGGLPEDGDGRPGAGFGLPGPDQLALGAPGGLPALPGAGFAAVGADMSGLPELPDLPDLP